MQGTVVLEYRDRLQEKEIVCMLCMMCQIVSNGVKQATLFSPQTKTRGVQEGLESARVVLELQVKPEIEDPPGGCNVEVRDCFPTQAVIRQNR